MALTNRPPLATRYRAFYLRCRRLRRVLPSWRVFARVRRPSRWHVRWQSAQRRVLVDTHDLRLGVFWVKRTGESFTHGAWLHLPCLVIDLTRYQHDPADATGRGVAS